VGLLQVDVVHRHHCGVLCNPQDVSDHLSHDMSTVFEVRVELNVRWFDGLGERFNVAEISAIEFLDSSTCQSGRKDVEVKSLAAMLARSYVPSSTT
jgi:hypothetical protein